jgi:uncharacterized protein YecE (DUF72 family)
MAFFKRMKMAKELRNWGERVQQAQQEHSNWVMFNNIRDIKTDIGILSNRITVAFEYVTTVMAAHLVQFHTKPAPKKPGKKNPYDKKYTSEKLNKLVEMIRKA